MLKQSLILAVILFTAGQAFTADKKPSYRETLKWLETKTEKWYRQTRNYSHDSYRIYTQTWQNEGHDKVIYTIFANEVDAMKYTFYLSDLNPTTVSIYPHGGDFFDVEVTTDHQRELIKYEIMGAENLYPWIKKLSIRINSKEEAERYVNALRHVIVEAKKNKVTKPKNDIF